MGKNNRGKKTKRQNWVAKLLRGRRYGQRRIPDKRTKLLAQLAQKDSNWT